MQTSQIPLKICNWVAFIDKQGVPRIIPTGRVFVNKIKLEIENFFEMCVFLVNILIDLIIRCNYELLQIVRLWNLKPITHPEIPYLIIHPTPSWKILIYFLQTCLILQTIDKKRLWYWRFYVVKPENRRGGSVARAFVSHAGGHGSSRVCDRPNSLKQVLTAPPPNPG